MLRPLRSERAARRPRHAQYASLHRDRPRATPVTTTTGESDSNGSSGSSSGSGSSSSGDSSDSSSSEGSGSSGDSSSSSSSSADSEDERGGNRREFSPRDAAVTAEEEEEAFALADGATRPATRHSAARAVGAHHSTSRRSSDGGAKRGNNADAAVLRTILTWYVILLPLGICFFTTLYVYNTSTPPLSASGNGRSVLMIIIDDMRPVQAAYGQQRLGPWNASFTPHLDSFAEGALSFTRAYAQVR
jgi:hypothetical protein